MSVKGTTKTKRIHGHSLMMKGICVQETLDIRIEMAMFS